MVKNQTSINGLNPTYTVHVTVLLPKRNIVKKYKGVLTRQFPELQNLSDEELKELTDS